MCDRLKAEIMENINTPYAVGMFSFNKVKLEPGTSIDEAGGSNIPSGTSKGEDQPEKRFGRDHLDVGALSKKQKNGKNIIRQKSSTRRKTKKLAVVERQYFVRQCKKRMHSQFQKSETALYYGIKSIYLNENALPNPDVIEEKAVAISAITGEQRKDIQTKKVNEVVIRYSAHVKWSNEIQMYNQLTIENMDFQPGDSGTCIYAICSQEKDSGSIGMFIGQSTSGQFIVTPMDEILKALGVD